MSDIGKRTIEALEDFSRRLAIAGGDIHATGLRTTTWRRCECNPFGDLIRTTEPRPDPRSPCAKCGGCGAVRVVNDGTGGTN
jgi:hypothetical protein